MVYACQEMRWWNDEYNEMHQLWFTENKFHLWIFLCINNTKLISFLSVLVFCLNWLLLHGVFDNPPLAVVQFSLSPDTPPQQIGSETFCTHLTCSDFLGSWSRSTAISLGTVHLPSLYIFTVVESVSFLPLISSVMRFFKGGCCNH